MNEMDDVFYSDDDYDQQIAQNEYNQIKNKFQQMGIRQGFMSGIEHIPKEQQITAIKQGFERGLTKSYFKGRIESLLSLSQLKLNKPSDHIIKDLQHLLNQIDLLHNIENSHQFEQALKVLEQELQYSFE